MKVISRREFRNNSAAIMHAVEAQMRQGADDFFGNEDRLGDHSPWEHPRG